MSATAHVNRDGSRASGWGRGAHGFWEKVNKRSDGCWDWTSYLDRDGAGKYTAKDGRTWRAARFAWEQLVGPVPAGLMLLNVVCRNARCVNPAHRQPIPKTHLKAWVLGLGWPCRIGNTRGELSGRATTTEDEVRDIRAEYSTAKSKYGILKRLAADYGLGYQAVCSIVYKKSWKHLIGRPRGLRALSAPPPRPPVETIDPALQRRIVDAYRDDVLMADLEERFQRSREAIERIVLWSGGALRGDE